jgi:hypothetical protein
MWVAVPYLPEADAVGLARVLREEETVEARRHEVRRAFREVSHDDPARAREVALGVVEDLTRAAEQLERRIKTERAWGLGAPAGGIVMSVAIGATAGPVGALAALAAALGLGPYVAMMRARKQNAAYALVLAKGAAKSERKPRHATALLKLQGPLTAELHE